MKGENTKEIVMVYQEMSGDAIKSRLNVWAYLGRQEEGLEGCLLGTGRPVRRQKLVQVGHGEALTKAVDAEEETNL